MNKQDGQGFESRRALSRRYFSMLFGSCVSTIALTGLAFGKSNGKGSAAGEEEISHACETIHQTIVFKASRKRVYEALIDEEQFDKVIKMSAALQSEGKGLGTKPTKIERVAGGTFTLFGGHILGRHVELVPGERIVQAWRVATWEAGVYSIARFQFSDQGGDTKLVFDHTGFPNGLGEHLARGWRGNYWEPLAKVLA